MLLAAAALAAVIMILVGHYERRLAAMAAHPRVEVKIVPRTYYDDMTGVDWVSSSTAAAAAASVAGPDPSGSQRRGLRGAGPPPAGG